jgi:hypothetical protein
MSQGTTITAQRIQILLSRAKVESTKIGIKTTVMCVTLPNGFEITAASACVDPTLYDQKKGEAICMDVITKKLWELEGYLLQERLSEADDHA